MITEETNSPSIQPEEISARARQLWQQANSPEGRDLEFWLAAEQDLQKDRREVRETKQGVQTPPTSTPSGGERAAPARRSSNGASTKKTGARGRSN